MTRIQRGYKENAKRTQHVWAYEIDEWADDETEGLKAKKLGFQREQEAKKQEASRRTRRPHTSTNV